MGGFPFLEQEIGLPVHIAWQQEASPSP